MAKGTSIGTLARQPYQQAPHWHPRGAPEKVGVSDSSRIELREIHLARQSSLQVPVGHIPVPGGIKLCSPGTFGVANYLILKNGSYQVNFTKPNRATIRYTNSQWLPEDATEASVGRGRRAEARSEERFATRGCHRGTCRQGGRAEDRSEECFATRGCH